ncbi:MAG: deoxyribodipyrimidine photolyase, partial [Planctomycetota bacterium]
PESSQPLLTALSDIEMRPCWAVMLKVKGMPHVDFGGAFVDNSPLSWIALDSSKPGRSNRDGSQNWVLHGQWQWSAQNVEASRSEVETALTAAFESATGIKIHDEQIISRVAHLWRFAIPTHAHVTAPDHYFDAESGLGLCGDWCVSGRVEGACLSGMGLAGAVLRQLTLGQTSNKIATEFQFA